jgi:hypothetical protein
MQGAALLEIVEGGDHSFKVPKTLGLRQEAVYQWILEKTVEWIGAEMRTVFSCK